MQHNKLAEDFSKFGKIFQCKLVQIMFYERPFCDQIREVFKTNYLETRYLQAFVERLYDYKDKHGQHPSSDAMVSVLRTELDEESDLLKSQVRAFFAETKALEDNSKKSKVEIDDSVYIKATAVDFCKKQKLRDAMIESATLLKSASFERISQIMNDALLAGTSRDFGHAYLKDFEERYKPNSRSSVTTGWDLVDKISKGGHGAGELGVVVAPTGAGKSFMLVHLGAAALRAGLNVVHYTLELSDKAVGLRYDACLTKYHLSDLYTFKDEILEKISDQEFGELVIKEYPTRKASTATIKNNLEQLASSGYKVDFVIVDYGDLLRPVTAYKEKRQELETIYEELRGLAGELKVPFWTASQTNRTGLNAEVITLESIAEAFAKCFPADLIITLSRTIKDKAQNSGKMFVAKNRNGPDGLIFPLFMDTSNARIEVLEPTSETVEDAAKETVKNEKNLLREKYKEFKKKSKS